MKAHLTKVSLALLSTVFLFGCQDLGSGPVGPEGLGPEFAKPGNRCPGHPSCSGDDASVSVTMTGGMNTGGASQPMQIREKRKEVRMNTNEGAIFVAIDMMHTSDAGRDPDGNIRYDEATGIIRDDNDGTLCVQTGDDAPAKAVALELFAKLLQPDLVTSNVLVVIDKRSLPGSSEDHWILIWGGELGRIKVIGAPTVELLEGSFTPADFTLEFSDGDIELTGSTESGHLHLTCEIQSGDVFNFVAGPSV